MLPLSFFSVVATSSMPALHPKCRCSRLLVNVDLDPILSGVDGCLGFPAWVWLAGKRRQRPLSSPPLGLWEDAGRHHRHDRASPPYRKTLCPLSARLPKDRCRTKQRSSHGDPRRCPHAGILGCHPAPCPLAAALGRTHCPLGLEGVRVGNDCSRIQLGVLPI